MSLNPYFQSSPYNQQTNEQDLYEDLIIESIQCFGIDAFYIPREVVFVDSIFREDRFSQFKQAIRIEMYLEDYTGFTGQGEFYDKFGLHMPDQARLMVSRKRWDQLVGSSAKNLQLPERPAEGDLVFIGGDANDLLQIKFVEHEEQAFYQLGRLYIWQLKCEKFVYSHNEIKTEIDQIDSGYLSNIDLISEIEELPTLIEMETPRPDLGEDSSLGDISFAMGFEIEQQADKVLVTTEENVFGKVGGKAPPVKRRKRI
jgi:hypothetical protein